MCVYKNLKPCGSSFYWASVANAPNVLQPYWLTVRPLDFPDLIAGLLLWGPSGQRWRCLWTFLFSNVPTFATSRLREILAVKGGTTWARNGQWILPENTRLPRNIQGSFTCRKSTWDRRLCFPSEGRRAEDFFALKNPTASVVLDPWTWVPKASTPPLDHRSRVNYHLVESTECSLSITPCFAPILMFSSPLICPRSFFSVGVPAKVPCAFLGSPIHAMPPPSPRMSVWLGHPDQCSANCVISGAEWSPDRQARGGSFRGRTKRLHQNV